MGAFDKAWYHTCPIHKKENNLFFKRCRKCQILAHAKTFREIRLMLVAMDLAHNTNKEIHELKELDNRYSKKQQKASI